MTRRKQMTSGMTLVEVMVAVGLSFMLLVLIGDLYTDSLKAYKKTDFTQLAQKFAGVIIESMSREIRGAVRVEMPTNNIIPYPIDVVNYPIEDTRAGYGSGVAPTPYVAFSKTASPVNQRAFCFHYNRQDRGIYYYSQICNLDIANRFTLLTIGSTLANLPNGSPPCLKRFTSDSRLTIENLEFWCAPDAVVMRVIITNTAYTRYYNYDNNNPNIHGSTPLDQVDASCDSAAVNQFPYSVRPRIEQSMFVSIRYYN